MELNRCDAIIGDAMTKSSYDDIVRAETIIELANGLLTMTRDIMTIHGEGGKQLHAMIAAAYVMAIKDIGNKIDSEIPYTIAKLVKEKPVH